MSCAKLSENDRDILNRIFSPHNPNAVNIDDIADSCNADKPAESEVHPVQESEADKRAHELELEAVRHAEAGKIDDAIATFGKAIETSPEYASAYNNRAQAYRMAGKNEGE